MRRKRRKRVHDVMKALLNEIRHNPLVRRPAFAPAALTATLTASPVINIGRSAWFFGVLMVMVHREFAMILYLLPSRTE